MRIFIPAVFAAATIAGSLAAQTSHSTSTAKSTAHRAHRKSTGTHAVAKTTAPAATTQVKNGSSTTGHRGTASKSGKKTAVTVARRSYQQQPTPDRYREIQQALADKGYFAGQPDGNWGPESVESLKRFQHDQNLTEDGKIGSLSLIALGLGPKRTPIDAGAGAVAPQAQFQAAPQPRDAAPTIPQQPLH